MTPLSDRDSTTSGARIGLRRIADLLDEAVDRVRPTPETRSERARREAREFLERRREAIAKAFEAR